MQDYYNIRVNFKGGLTSAKELGDILRIAKNNNVADVRFGLRQQMFVPVKHALIPRFSEDMKAVGKTFDVDQDVHPNIISSYVGEDVFQDVNWLSENTFKELFEKFDYAPKLKINLSDNNQSFTPYFSGHLNFVASDVEHYWYFTVRIPKSNGVFAFKKLVHTNNVVAVCKALEKLFEQELSSEELQKVWDCIEQHAKTISAPKALPLHDFRLPYYEGFNRYSNKTWLGVYRRDEKFDINFLLEICNLCERANATEICITPWKSIIIKGIEDEFRLSFSNLLAKYNINVRHAANELNWQVEDDSDDALELKQYVASYFEKIDLRTFGICFGIKTRPKTEVFASIMIRRRYFNLFGVLPLYYVYDISYTKDFDPNGRTKIYYATDVRKSNLNQKMFEIVQLYNEQSAENRIEKVDNQL